MHVFRCIAVAVAAAAVCALLASAAAGSPSTAALQVALRARGLYAGTVDGVRGPGTAGAIRALPGPHGARGGRHRRAAHPPPAGLARAPVARPARALRGPPRLGRRGAPVPARPSGLPVRPGGRRPRRADGRGAAPLPGLGGARRRRPGRPGDARGPASRAADHLAALPGARSRRRSATGSGRAATRSTRAWTTPAGWGVPVTAAGYGCVVTVTWDTGFGNLVVIQHRFGVTSWYAHLNTVAVRRGSVRRGGRPRRQRRLHRPLDGPPPALRAARARGVDRPAARHQCTPRMRWESATASPDGCCSPVSCSPRAAEDSGNTL